MLGPQQPQTITQKFRETGYSRRHVATSSAPCRKVMARPERVGVIGSLNPESVGEQRCIPGDRPRHIATLAPPRGKISARGESVEMVGSDQLRQVVH